MSLGQADPVVLVLLLKCCSPSSTLTLCFRKSPKHAHRTSQTKYLPGTSGTKVPTLSSRQTNPWEPPKLKSRSLPRWRSSSRKRIRSEEIRMVSGLQTTRVPLNTQLVERWLTLEHSPCGSSTPTRDRPRQATQQRSSEYYLSSSTITPLIMVLCQHHCHPRPEPSKQGRCHPRVGYLAHSCQTSRTPLAPR